MAYKLVVLWTDVALWGLLAGLLAYGLRIRAHPQLRATWARVLRDPVAASSGVVLTLMLGVTLLDSLHLRSELPPGAAGQKMQAEQTSDERVYDTRTVSVLDLLLARQIAMREISYSAPLAYLGFNKEPIDAAGEGVGYGTRTEGEAGSEAAGRGFPRLQFGGAHLRQPEQEWGADVARRAGAGLAWGALLTALLAILLAAGLATSHGGFKSAGRDLLMDRTHYPWRAMLLTCAVTALLAGPALALMDHYHVLGTDRTGNDVLYQALKSLRTAFVIGALSTLATLPFALALGVLAGYFRGWVDEVVQYLYTTLSSVPNVLLIAACVLMVQVFLDKNPDLFETGVERADLKMFMLCLILGVTGWAGLCRLVRAETLKLRELDYVQAAHAFGVSHGRIMARHVLPNVLHLVLISVVLSFSELILYEAVLTYVGVGVDPTMNSFGSMINLARSEMSSDPVVWWSFCAAFGFMLTLVLAANLFADGVRDAFDPRSRNARPHRSKTLKVRG
ncbi:ABC transporter permease [Paucibacter sp. AS339]|uniref:ABC transporter permease n=1 Tax=Paucibacter hankyongi TaxID=3133434 RepID=UPI0030AEA322